MLLRISSIVLIISSFHTFWVILAKMLGIHRVRLSFVGIFLVQILLAFLGMNIMLLGSLGLLLGVVLEDREGQRFWWEYAFYSLYPPVFFDIIVRFVGIFILPLIFNQELAVIRNDITYHWLAYVVPLPAFYYFNRLTLFEPKGFQRLKKYHDGHRVISLVVLLFCYLILSIWIPGSVRSFFVFNSAVLLLLSMGYLNQFFKSELMLDLENEQYYHLTTLVDYNQKIDELLTQLRFSKLCYQQLHQEYSNLGENSDEELRLLYHKAIDQGIQAILEDETYLDQLTVIEDNDFKTLIARGIIEAKYRGIRVNLVIDSFNQDVVIDKTELADDLIKLFSMGLAIARRQYQKQIKVMLRQTEAGFHAFYEIGSQEARHSLAEWCGPGELHHYQKLIDANQSDVLVKTLEGQLYKCYIKLDRKDGEGS